MPFVKGKSGNLSGRPKGSENELTKKMKTVKETVLSVFNELQGEGSNVDLKTWATKNPTEFYKISAKLIPTEIKGEVAVIEKKLPSWIENEDKHEP